jgi:4-amino-4-deoxy-L-arabinose transferase-like glycosyltransferase
VPLPAAPSVLRAAVAAGIVVVLGVELASAVSGLTAFTMGLLGLTAIALAITLAARSRRPVDLGPLGLEQVVVGVVALATLVTALVAAPNTWDSMTYHLARVEQWLSRGSVAHYPTSVDRQLWQPPFGEYLLLTARSLGGGDRLVNLVQWLASLGCALTAAAAARSLGLGPRGGWLAAGLVLTMPVVVLEATSTQNDLVAALWIAILAALAIEPVEAGRSRSGWAWIGGAFALAVGTKGVALIFGLPLLLLAVAMRWRWGAGGALRGLALVAAIVVAVNGAWLIRNQRTYGNPGGDPEVQRLLRPATLAPTGLAANLIANASIHWSLPGEPARRAAETVVETVNRALGVDPAALFPYFGGLRAEPWSTDEDLAGNPLLFLLTALALAMAARRWSSLGPQARGWVLALAAAILLFGVAVRWQPFNARLHLPGFVLAVPLVAAMLERGRERWGHVLLLLALIGALPPLLANTIRPWVGPRWQPTPGAVPVGSIFTTPRVEQYFARQPAQYPVFRSVVGRLAEGDCRRVGVKAGYDSWEYPLWALSRGLRPPARFVQIEVANPTGREAVESEPRTARTLALEPPCAIIGIDQPAAWVPGEASRGWSRAEAARRLTLWLPDRPPSGTR